MGCAVYANGMSIACKVADGKTIAAMPDVCLSPPTPPAGPVPLPYPNTAMASDTDNGSKTVQIGGQEVMLKDQSTFKKSTGDEAATKSLGMGVVSHQIQGEVNFAAWSMDVKFEGENVPRHLDLTLHNEMCTPANTPTWPYIDKNAMPRLGPCSKEAAKEKDACSGKNTRAKQCADKKCRNARACMLVPNKPDRRAGQGGCCKGQTPHHLVEVHSFTPSGGRVKGVRLQQFSEYQDKKAPCVCCDESSRYYGDHGSMHAIQGMWERAHMNPPPAPRSQMGGNGGWNYGAAKKGALAAHSKTFKKAGCRDGCIDAQLDAYHKQIGVEGNDTPLRADRSPLKEKQAKFGANVMGRLNMLPGGRPATF
jgi:hypothetical protein